MSLPKREYHFFYGGVFSQWMLSDPLGGSQFEIDGVKYNCAEQFMMAEKARRFNDEAALAKIMDARHPADQKRLGKTVKNLEGRKGWSQVDRDHWNSVARDVVYRGNWAKFTQNKGLQYALQNTGDKILVEASPTDKIWGIGIDIIDAEKHNPQPDQWNGTNWLGQVITLVREDIRAGGPSENIDWDQVPWN
jgi:ribA/ribD-fused uncharacterized protein